MTRTLPDPSTLDWGNMSKAEFKSTELAYELADEDSSLHKRNKSYGTLQLRTFPTQEALALAYAAYRRNNNEYVKDTRRFSTEGNKPIYSNKELIKYTIEAQEGRWTPDDFEPLVVTEEDYASVEDCRSHFKRYTMLSLGELSDFQKGIFEVVSADVHKQIDGRIAYVPQFVVNERKENALKKAIRVDYRDSQNLGKVGESVEGVIKILERYWSNQYERYSYVAVMDGNIVSFMNAHRHDIDTHKRIKAKVKAHRTNRLFSVPETRLNYVKLYKV